MRSSNLNSKLKITDGIAYQKMLSSFAAECDISSQEACHILYELSLVKPSCSYRSIYISPDESSENVNFDSSEKEQRGILERYKTRPIVQKPELKDVSLQLAGTGRVTNILKEVLEVQNLLWSMFGLVINLIQMNQKPMKSIVMPECFFIIHLSMSPKTCY
jgi:hypothetical protein